MNDLQRLEIHGVCLHSETFESFYRVRLTYRCKKKLIASIVRKVEQRETRGGVCRNFRLSYINLYLFVFGRWSLTKGRKRKEEGKGAWCTDSCDDGSDVGTFASLVVSIKLAACLLLFLAPPPPLPSSPLARRCNNGHGLALVSYHRCNIARHRRRLIVLRPFMRRTRHAAGLALY